MFENFYMFIYIILYLSFRVFNLDILILFDVYKRMAYFQIVEILSF